MTKTIANIIQITDNHLLGDKSKSFLGVNTYTHLKAVITEINLKVNANEIPKPDLVLFTGDISQDFTENSYKLMLDLCDNLPYKIAAIPGNHDVPDLFKNILGNSKIDILKKRINFNNWQIVLLNSQWPAKIAGLLDANELNYLDIVLAENTSKPTIIFLHHHALPTNEQWLDQHILTNADAFFNIIDKYPNIKAVFYGHIHQENELVRNNVKFISTPATAFQFAKNNPTFKLDSQMPGYRLIQLLENSTFKTEVFRISQNKNFIPDLTSKGY